MYEPLVNLAVAYQGKGDYISSESYYVEALQAIKPTGGEKSTQIADVYNRLVNLYLDHLNKPLEAKKYMGEIRKIYCDLFGINNETTKQMLKKLQEIEPRLSVQLEKKLRNAAAQNNVELLKKLIQENKSLNINARDNGKTVRTALHWAVIKENVECVKLLLAAGADATIKDKENKHAIDYAIHSNKADIRELFLDVQTVEETSSSSSRTFFQL